MLNTMEQVSKNGQEEHLSVPCPQYMQDWTNSQVIEIPPRTVLLKLMEASGAKESPIFKFVPSESLCFKADEQVIEIPPRRVLLKVMESIGAKVGPVYTCTPCGSMNFKVSVELDVTGATFTVGKTPLVAKVEGEICGSPALAETSAVMNALKYLGQKHCIQALDYSSSIIKMLGLGYDWGDVDELDCLIKKLIKHWDESLKQCEKLSQYLDYKVIMDHNHADKTTEASEVYSTVDDLIMYSIKRYSCVPVYARSELEKIQDERLKYNQNSTKKHNEVHYLQSVWFSEKDVLDYVLSYLGIGKAKYNNVSCNGGMVEGEAKFFFPCVVEGRFHKLEVHSRSLASSRAEEAAARAALLFMESKLNLMIVDFNYADRQIAEKEHKSLEFIKERFIVVGHQMKTHLGNMVRWLAAVCAACSGDARSMFGGPLSQEQMMAIEFCSQRLEAVRADCATRYESSTSMFEEIEKLCWRLE